MKKRSLTCKIVVGILSLSLMLIPVSSMAEGENPTAAGVAGTGGITELSMAAKIGIVTAVAAAGIAVAVATDDDEVAQAHPSH